MRYTICFVLFIFISTSATAQREGRDFDYGNNLITFSPANVFADGFGLYALASLGYERFTSEFVSLKVPVFIGLDDPYFMTELQVKLYPAGHNRPIKYSVAPTFYMSTFNYTDIRSEWDPNTGQSFQRSVDGSCIQLGFKLNSALNITMAGKYYINIESGLGLSYLNRNVEDGERTNFTARPAAGFGINLGYRF